MWTQFQCRTKIGTYPMKVIVLHHSMIIIRSDREAKNLPMMLVDNVWVYESTSGALGEGNIKRLDHFTQGKHVINCSYGKEVNDA